MSEKKILIICGEASGELHAASLISALKKLSPQTKVFGVGSLLLQQAGAEIVFDTKGLAVFGLFDVLKKLPQFFGLKKLLLQKIQQEKIDCVILVDFSGFNLRLAKAINNTVPVIYYVSPQVWASRKGRIKTIKQFIRKMIVLFKFEEEFYRKHRVGVDWVGHPLLDIVRPSMEKKELLRQLKLSDSKITIALLPGSRRQEINHILPIMLRSARCISEKRDTQYIIAKTAQVDWDVYNRIVKKYGVDAKIVEARTYDCLNAADFCLVCSGTATLETAIMQKPFCIIYKMSFLNYLLYRPQVKLPYIGMVNIVAGRKIIPEFIQFGADPKKICREALLVINDPVRLQQTKADLAAIKSHLGSPGAINRAAKIVSDFIAG